MATKRKKLYFDVTLPAGLGAAGGLIARNFPCTQFRSTGSYTGDIYGGVLDDVPALTTSAPSETKRRNEVSAWFVPTSAQALQLTLGAIAVAFTIPTTVQTITAATLLVNTAGPDGSTPIYTRHFGVQVRRYGQATMTGRLYVQRQHSIEV